MRRSSVFVIPFFLTIVLFPPFDSAALAQHGKGQDAVVAVVSAEQVKELKAGKGKVFIVDARSRKEYLYGHIPGAVNIPSPAVRAFPKRLPKNKSTLLIVYDRGDNFLAVDRATNAVVKMGYTNVRRFLGGMLEWTGKHYPVKKGARP
jgi:hydroxyacylglutathione hydrolase